MTAVFQSVNDLWWLPILVGPIIGSYLSLLVVRLPAGEPTMWTRSACRSCGQTLSWRDLIPFVSWLMTRGKCRNCGTSISLLYPVMELGTALIAIWSIYVVDPWAVWPSCVFGWVLLAIGATDYRNMIIPDVLSLPLIPLGIGVAFLAGGWPQTVEHIGAAAAAGLALYLVGALYLRYRGREGLGFGDVKLVAGSGAWLAFQGTASAVALGAMSALLYVFGKRVFGKTVRSDTKVPLGTFLCLGMWLVWLYGPLISAY